MITAIFVVQCFALVFQIALYGAMVKLFDRGIIVRTASHRRSVDNTWPDRENL
jgi:hypothetical protein